MSVKYTAGPNAASSPGRPEGLDLIWKTNNKDPIFFQAKKTLHKDTFDHYYVYFIYVNSLKTKHNLSALH